MPATKRKSKAKKYWFTEAYLTAEGQPHPAHPYFVHVYQQLAFWLANAQYAMTHEIAHRGAYVKVVWPGQLSQYDALHSDIKPLYYVFQGGRTERL